MNPFRLFYFVSSKSTQARLLAADKPTVRQLMLWYILPLSTVLCLMMYLSLSYHYPKLFFDRLPGDRLLLISAELLCLQLLVVLSMAWITQRLAGMINQRASFRDALLIMAIGTTPLWLASLVYWVPDLRVNVVMHGLAVAVSVLLVYRGVRYIFGVRERGALMTLTAAIVCSAALAFAVVLIGSLTSWEGIEQLQFAIQKL